MIEGYVFYQCFQLCNELPEGLYAIFQIVTAMSYVGVVLGGWGRTLIRNEHWKNHETLYQSTLDVNPNSLIGLRGRGFNYFKLNQHGLALQDYEKIVELRPEDMKYSGAMIGRLRLMRKIFDGDDSDDNYAKAKNALEVASEFQHSMQPQAMHDLGYLTWFEGSGGEEGSRENAREAFNHCLEGGDRNRILNKYPSLDGKTMAVFLNNAACSNFLTSSGNMEQTVSLMTKAIDSWGEENYDNGVDGDLTEALQGARKIFQFNLCIAYVHMNELELAKECLDGLGETYVSGDLVVRGDVVKNLIEAKELGGEEAQVEPYCLFTFTFL